jgi:hypothetical protein
MPARILAAAALCAALLAGAARADTPPAGGLLVTVVPPAGTADAAAFERAALAAMPPRLLDPGTNFMQDALARADAPYRLVLVFGAPGMDAAAACAPAPSAGSDPARAVLAVLCHDDEPLASAGDRLPAGLDASQAAFRFLVGDLARRVFATGFDQLPRRPERR